MKKIFFLLFLSFCINSIESDVAENRRIDCAPGRIKNKDFCVSKGCIWDNNSEPDSVPLCYFPANTGYIVAQGSFSGGDKTVNLKKSSQSVQNPFGTDFSDLVFQWKEIGAGVYIKIAPSQGTRLAF
uniref:P-type domain-containing protein n=1 Tax=Panagrolaimus sp. PS1159 TaxID=55785 RepID=A0AC35EZJ5_9BILA